MIMDYINNRSSFYNLKLQWSDPDYYYETIKTHFLENSAISFSQNLHDFFPYADNPNSYWTGFYTSRPALKGYIQTRQNLLHALDQFSFYTLPFFSSSSSVSSGNGESLIFQGPLFPLRNASAVVLHHDAITGTCRDHVAENYIYLLWAGTETANAFLTGSINQILNTTSQNSHLKQFKRESKESKELKSKGASLGESKKLPKFDQETDDNLLDFQSCPFLNISSCLVLESIQNENAVVLLSNPVAWPRNEIIRLPVPYSSFEVFDWNGRLLESQIVQRDSTLELVFSVKDIPPLGTFLFFFYQLFFILSVVFLFYQLFFSFALLTPFSGKH